MYRNRVRDGTTTPKGASRAVLGSVAAHALVPEGGGRMAVNTSEQIAKLRVRLVHRTVTRRTPTPAIIGRVGACGCGGRLPLRELIALPAPLAVHDIVERLVATMVR